MRRLENSHSNTSAAHWLRHAKPGYCSETSTGVCGVCGGGEKGQLGELPKTATTWEAAVALCLEWCRGCARCQHITVSLEFRDCSWYSHSACATLHTAPAGFRSARVPWTAHTGHGDCFESAAARELALARPPAQEPSIAEPRALALFGILSFGSRHGAERRRHEMRHFWARDPTALSAMARFRFLMLQRDAVGTNETGDAWAFSAADLGYHEDATPSGPGVSMLLTAAFYKRALRETPSIEWIGITDTDTLFNVSALAWRLLRVSEAVGAPRKRYAVYGLLSEWIAWDRDDYRFSCFDYGPDRGVQAARALDAAGGNLSALPGWQQECVRPGVIGPFPLGGGPMILYSRAVVEAWTSVPRFARDRHKIVAESGRLQKENNVLATGQLAEDLWVSSLYYEALKDRPLQLVLAQLREGDIQQQLEQCELPQQFEGREFSAMAYHGLKDAKAWHAAASQRFLMHHEADETLVCEAEGERTTHCCAKWRWCEFKWDRSSRIGA